jgi:uncharacterized protein YkwD
MGVGTGQAVTMTFDQPMDAASVEAALTLAPSHAFHAAWSADARELSLNPYGPWLTDARYAVVVGATARSASGAQLGAPARFSFTTQTAPRITDFGLHFVAEPVAGAAALDAGETDLAGPPPDTASGVSAGTSIVIAFSAPMNQAEVERAFALTPAVPGAFHWDGGVLTFRPSERLASNARYAVSLVGAHDRDGNALGGDASFSFTTRAGAQLVQTAPAANATEQASTTQIALWFSQAMDGGSVASALQVRDGTTGAILTGQLAWNSLATQVTFTPDRALAAGHRFDVSLADGAVDADGNAVTAGLTFTTKAAVVVRPRVAPAPGPASSLVGYALDQVNSTRAAYGFGPLILSSAISAVANGHAWDMLNNNYFSHTGLDGRTYEDRLRNGGIVFGWSGENICYSNNSARSPTDVLNWCQSQFLSEPYPGIANHLANILGSHYTRIGIGIAVSGSKVYVTWDFTD